MIIAFGHRKQQGKDTAVDAIYNYDSWVRRVSFAEPLYELCCRLIPEFQTKHFYDRHPADKERMILRLGKTPREILIETGQSLKKIAGDDVFVRSFVDHYADRRDTNVVVSDLRFRIEAEMLKKHKCVTVKVVRPSVIPISDYADDDLSDWDGWDYTLVNDGTIDDFKQKAIDLYKRITGI